MFLSVLFYTLVVCAVIQIIYYCCFSSIFFQKKKIKSVITNHPVSVIICAKNEAENLKTFLPCILQQEYLNFEVVVINDGSTDNTQKVLASFKEKYHYLKIINVAPVESFWGNKKFALTLGIKAAKYDYLLFTDADCKPVSKLWITEMVSSFTNEKEIILGYGKYSYEKKLVNLFIRFETLLTAIQYFAYAKFGIPYMAVGRNLAYKKEKFFTIKGFAKHIHLKSGDDDLFVQDASNSTNTAINMSPNSFTKSIAPDSFISWFRQKRRHISTANYYKKHHQILLGLFFLSKFFLYFTGIFLLFTPYSKISLLLYFIYLSIQFIVVGISTKKLNEPKLIYYLPFLEIGLLIFQFSIFMANLVAKPNHWK